MADNLTTTELDSMKKSLDLMTDLSKNLRGEFIKIRNTTNLIGDDFKNIVENAKNNKNITEKYLVAQKASQVLTEKINELKSKSGYLDNVSLQFKKDELELQKRITTAQISRLLRSNALDAAAKKEAIDALKLKMILSDTELDFLDKKAGKNNGVVDSLNQQLIQTEGILENIRLTESGMINTNSALKTVTSSFGFLLGRSGLIVKDLGKLGEYLQNGVTPATLIADIIKIGYENFKAFDKAAASVRANLGILPGQANKLETTLRDVSIDMMHLGATFDDVAKSITSISNTFGSLVARDADLLKTTTAFSKQFGIAEDTSVKFLETLGGIAGKSAKSQLAMTGFAQKMAQASGVPLGKIMEDVANASDDVRVYVGNSAVSMIKAAAAARMMGIDLNKAAASAEKLLQFESSISSELKASALLGQNVNFNYARQLAFNKDIIGANKEILKISKQVNFNQLNPIQQKAFADAAGKSVSELQSMLQQEKNIQLVKNGTNKEAKAALAEYDRLMKLKDEEAKKEGEIAEKQAIQAANQARMERLQNEFNKLMSELAKPVMAILNPLADLAILVLPKITEGLKHFGAFLKPIGNALIMLADKMSLRFLSPLLKGIGIFSRFLGPLGIIVNLFSFVTSLMKRWEETPDGILGGLQAIGGALYDTLLKPFVDVYDWIMDKLGGKSPSEIGLSIVKGLVSVSGMILDALTRPFIKGYNFISKYIPGASELKMPSEVLSDIAGDTKKSKETINASAGENNLLQTIQSGNQQLVAKMDQLIAMMANGGIAVNLDGQRINAALSTSMLKSGGFGQATTRA